MSVGRSGLRAITLGWLAVLLLVAFGASSAWAEPSTYCVKATKVSKIISGKTKHVFTGGWTDSHCMSVNATHEGKFEKLASFTAPEEAQLKALLKYMTVQASGVGGKPTVKLTGANLQVASGPKEAETNGVGNVVIGADEAPRTQTGSNNLVMGGQEQEFTSYGSILGGELNAVTAPFASVTGGAFNLASMLFASVSGGGLNTASAELASVSGGGENTADATYAAISGGRAGTASGDYSSVTGGKFNTASAGESSVSGGQGNVAGGPFAASISGGEDNKASGSVSWIGGGFKNEVFSNAKAGEEGFRASIFGGKELKTAKDYEAIP